jgi:aryl-alcohol dehydrogenase-like predicted oxidoreductase
MKYTTLPNSSLKVSKICLGTMTFGEQNTEAEAHSQLDFALDKGVNFIDTAEMYSTPARNETYGISERIIGKWIKKHNNREDFVLASKIAGPNRGLEYIREDMGFSAKTISLSIEKSLQRLQTDYIDLYQLHWPERKSNMFGQRGFTVQEDAWDDNVHQVLVCLDDLIRQGKIRTIGLSNETPWGVMRFLEESKQHNLPRIATVQNPYSLLNRTFEIGLSEVCHRENVGLLAYSPLAFGVLSGKFLTGEVHPKARINLFPQFSRYNSDNSREASKRYAQIAQDFSLSLTELSLAFIEKQSFVTSAVIGATTLEQLEENIKTISVSLNDAIMCEIENIQNLIPNPAP